MIIIVIYPTEIRDSTLSALSGSIIHKVRVRGSTSLQCNRQPHLYLGMCSNNDPYYIPPEIVWIGYEFVFVKYIVIK